MRLFRSLIYIVLSFFLSSCLITNFMQPMQVEIMKPAVFVIPDSVNSVAIFNLLPANRSDLSFDYMEGNAIKKDITVNYTEISNKCTNALADFLVKEKYFAKVRNFRDSLNYLKSDSIENKDLYKKLGVDACIFLSNMDFKLVTLRQLNSMIVNNVNLIWSVSYKSDTLAYWYSQNDTLLYKGEEFPLSVNQKDRIRYAANNSSEYLGNAFGAKLIPVWIPVERMYYQSNNTEMLKAEKYALDNQWLKAAEIWTKLTRNKNAVMAAKASYNMALACEMEGHLDAAMDWLVQSYSIILKENTTEHRVNCQRYISLLATRKKEIEKLAKQVRN